MTAELMTEFIGNACRRFPSVGQTKKTARIERLIGYGAWNDAALALPAAVAADFAYEIFISPPPSRFQMAF